MLNIFAICYPYSDDVADDTCFISYYILFFNTLVVIIIILSSIYKKTYRGFNFAVESSIFSYIGNGYFAQKKFLYLIIGFGSLFIRPLGYVLTNLLTYALNGDPENPSFLFEFSVKPLDTILSGLNVYTLVVMLFFFGAKLELLLSLGSFDIEEDYRKFFLNHVLKRANIVTMIFIIGRVLIDFTYGIPIYTSSPTQNNGVVYSIYRIYRNFGLFLICLYRMRITKLGDNLMEIGIFHWKQSEKYTLVTKHLQDYIAKKSRIKELIYAKGRHESHTNYKEILTSTYEELVYSLNYSIYCLKSKFDIISNDEARSAPLVLSTREESIVFIIWFLLSLCDTGFCTIMNFFSIILFTMRYEKYYLDTINVFSHIAIFFYVLESTIMGYLIYMVIRNKSNYGEMNETELIRFTTLPLSNTTSLESSPINSFFTSIHQTISRHTSLNKMQRSIELKDDIHIE